MSCTFCRNCSNFRDFNPIYIIVFSTERYSRAPHFKANRNYKKRHIIVKNSERKKSISGILNILMIKTHRKLPKCILMPNINLIFEKKRKMVVKTGFIDMIQ